MIELRWLERGCGTSAYTDEVERTLQYRVQTNPLEIGLREPLYGPWTDVPTVTDSEAKP